MVEAAKEANNVGRVTFVQYDKFPHDLCSHNWLDIQSYQLNTRCIYVQFYALSRNYIKFHYNKPVMFAIQQIFHENKIINVICFSKSHKNIKVKEPYLTQGVTHTFRGYAGAFLNHVN